MLELVQYHSPDVMGEGVDELEGPPFSLLTSKAPGNPVGARAWIVGKTQDFESPVYLACSFIVDNVVASPDPRFLYRYIGVSGANYRPLRCISDQAWYPQLEALTGNFRFGLTVLSQAVLQGLLAAAEELPAHTPRRGTSRTAARKHR